MLEQRSGFDVDANLVSPHATLEHRSHSRERLEITLDVADRPLELLLVDITPEVHVDHRHVRDDLEQLYALSIIWKILEPIDDPLQFIHRLGHVRAVVELDRDAGDTFRDRGAQTLDVIDVGDGILDLVDHRFLDLFRRRAGIDHRDPHGVGINLGEELPSEGECGVDPDHDRRKHEEVRWNRISYTK